MLDSGAAGKEEGEFEDITQFGANFTYTGLEKWLFGGEVQTSNKLRNRF